MNSERLPRDSAVGACSSSAIPGWSAPYTLIECDASAEGASSEIVALREERDQVRARVAGMLEQLEGVAL